MAAARAEGWRQQRQQEGSGSTTVGASYPSPSQRRLSHMPRPFGVACGSLANTGGIGGGAGAGRRMVETDGKGAAHAGSY